MFNGFSPNRYFCGDGKAFQLSFSHGCGSKAYPVAFWEGHFIVVSFKALGCSLGYRGFDPQPHAFWEFTVAPESNRSGAVIR